MAFWNVSNHVKLAKYYKGEYSTKVVTNIFLLLNWQGGNF
jgi:hypothetical protein